MFKIEPRTLLFYRNKSNNKQIKWKKIKRQIEKIKKFLMVFQSLFNQKTSVNCWNPCQITIVNFLGQKTSNRFQNRKPNNEVFQFLKFYHQKKRNYMKKLKRWLKNILGQYSPIVQLEMILKKLIHSCNLNQKFYKIILKIVVFTNL